MKREIKFRGKPTEEERRALVDVPVWVEGELSVRWKEGKEHCFIGVTVNDDCLYIEVIPDTIGQYTGLQDKNNVRIWEGDIVAEQENGGYRIRDVGEVQYREAICGYAIVYFKRGRMYVDPFKEGKQSYNDGWCTIHWVMEYEVIGNIHDNKELIKEE